MELQQKNTLAMLEQLLACESAPIWTQNNHYYKATSKKWHTAYVHQWYLAHPSAPMRHHPPPPPPESYADELQVMANVRAYFQVAYKVFRPATSY